jgi:acetoin utilization deacetylase AcuC-like enzyme
MNTTKTGVFFPDVFSQEVWHIINDKFRNYPEIMKDELQLPNVILLEPQKVYDELLIKVHTSRFLNELKKQWYCEGAYLTVGGCVQASELIMKGTLRNALVFGVAAGHHAERDYAWGGTYCSVSGPVVVNLHKKFPGIRIAILDTDSHHGNGTRDVTYGNPNVLHVCFCSSNKVEDEGTKICVNSGYNMTNNDYLNLVSEEFIVRVQNFKPDIILHLLGHDTAVGDYGNRGLSKEFFLELVQMIKKTASEICSGRYIINTHGGSNLNICEYIFPKIIRILAQD